MGNKILIVEDEPSMRLGLKDNLEFEGYTVDLAADGVIGLDMIFSTKYDLVLLDVMMPKMSGLEVCQKVREKGIGVFIILLTAKGEEIDKVKGLELGADDYITKPFGVRELLARIKAVMRRSSMTNDIVVRPDNCKIGKLEVDFNAYTAHDTGNPVKMSHKEYAVLSYLLEHKNKTVTRFELLENVWEYEESPTTRTVDNFIMKLRHKLEQDPNDPKIILTVHGTGYKLID